MPVHRTIFALLALASPLFAGEVPLTTLSRGKEAFPGATIQAKEAVLASLPWAFLRTKDLHDNVRVQVDCTLLEPASRFGFFGSSWSVWPDPTYADQGYEVGVQVRGGYRIQLSHRYQEVSLVRHTDGGYLRVVPCPVRLKQTHRLTVAIQGNEIRVQVDGVEKMVYVDDLPPLESAPVGLGTSSGARVRFEKVVLDRLADRPRQEARPHTPRLSSRAWLGGRPWVFDGDEPILLLPVPEATSINNVKLRPGHRPMLSWNSHWDIANQGAFPEGASTNGPVKVTGGGRTLTAAWTARQNKGRFATRTTMVIGFDARRRTYTYDVDSDLEVMGAEAFHFRYGYDFEHHTPLDPFRWQYLVMRKKGGALVHRPVYPIDPGPQNDLEPTRGLRLWYGRHNEKMTLAPAVEYDLPDGGKRKLDTAVCAAFYDTGVSFAPETARPGTRVRVRYRYTGYPAAEAEALFRESTIYPSPMLDPDHHYLFADQWPKLTFRAFAKMSETWIYGRRPFTTAHNQRPTYELARVETGYAMKLGPASFGAATLATPADLPAGRYALVARVKSDNATGPGGRIELSVTAPKTGKSLGKQVHYLGNGTFEWKTTGFVFEVPVRGAGLHLGLGNAGTGEVLVSEVDFRPLAKGAKLPTGVADKPNDAMPKQEPAPAGALADYRMEEGKGLFVFDHAGGPLGLLELANVGWKRDEGRPALVFADNVEKTRRYPRSRGLDLSYLRHPAYRGRDTLPVALAGHHGGGRPLKGFTLAAWIKPAEAMGKSDHAGRGDIVGLGARRIILRLIGQEAPYRLAASLNVNDVFESKASVVAGRWQHVALTGEPVGSRWRVRLYLDGKEVLEGRSSKLEAPTSIPPSLILGAEIFYLHDAYYRGLIGRTLVFERTLEAEEVGRLARGR